MQHQYALLSSISASHLLSTFGVLGVLVIIFAQTGLLVGFFLPGDSLLFLAGYATDRHNNLHVHMPLGWLLVAAAGGAIVGGQLGYEVGRRAGASLNERRSRFYKREFAERAERFLDRFGAGKAVTLSRFVPVVRTFTSPIVGVAGVGRSRYLVANVVGGLIWTVPIVVLGHFLGHVSFIRKYVEIIAVAAVVLSVIPASIHMLRARRANGT
ncbi:MAG TPA: VTT domain-containing protein [Mycobacteriales bacterium]|nr:VTT domain-containing protein [Mycobacteriales bacterium]HWA65571.1 VTT domain-containing protein [Mycobacteriales bacterium]